MKLGHVLADYCYANRLSVREFARELGLSPATAHRLCKGENVDAETIGRVVAWLFGGDEKRQKPVGGLGPTSAVKAAQARMRGEPPNPLDVVPDSASGVARHD